MKKRVVCLLSLLLTAVLLLSSCSSVTVMDAKDGLYVNPDTGVSYRAAPANYESKSVNKSKLIACLANEDMEENYLYAIDGVDTNRFLTTIYNDVFYADGIELPTLRSMNATRVLFTQTKVLTASLVQIDDDAVLSNLTTAYEGMSFDSDLMIFEDDCVRSLDFRLKFESEDYPSLYYTLDYHSYSKEITLWEPIDSIDSFEILYPGVEVTTAEENGYLYAVYHFGTDFLYDHVTGLCYPLWDVLTEYHDDLSDGTTT
ncbi:MAG: hypothetical protein IJW49_07570 [Clostridia bacterium]|nr:hypothetical protein [Clostridia bacterium]